jgi:hypothetical protein
MDENITLPHDAIILLERYAPTIYACVARNNRSRSAVVRKYDERWDSMKESFQKSGVFRAETCIFDLLWKASENDNHAISFLAFMDSVVNNALNLVDGKKIKLIQNLVVKMVTSFGRDNSEYRHHFAEIAVITKLIQTENISLNCVEKKLPNGCRADFEVIRNCEPILVEVYNINFEIKNIKDGGGLQRFLEKRLIDKIQSKFKELDRLPSPMMLVPVLWGDVIKIREFARAFDYFKDVSFLSPFMFVTQYRNIETGEVVYDFESLYNHMQ